MDCPELDDQLAYSDLLLKVVSNAEERYTRSENLRKAIALAIVECIDDEDMWTIIHHNCHDVYKAFYAGNLDYCLSSPHDVFFNDCRNTFLLNQLKVGE